MKDPTLTILDNKITNVLKTEEFKVTIDIKKTLRMIKKMQKKLTKMQGNLGLETQQG